jgi:hypothetical protein
VEKVDHQHQRRSAVEPIPSSTLDFLISNFVSHHVRESCAPLTFPAIAWTDTRGCLLSSKTASVLLASGRGPEARVSFSFEALLLVLVIVLVLAATADDSAPSPWFPFPPRIENRGRSIGRTASNSNCGSRSTLARELPPAECLEPAQLESDSGGAMQIITSANDAKPFISTPNPSFGGAITLARIESAKISVSVSHNQDLTYETNDFDRRCAAEIQC